MPAPYKQFRNAKDQAAVQPIDWALYSISVSSVQCSGIHYGSDHPSSYETTLKANRRISNIEPQNIEGWNRCAQPFF